MSTDKRTVVLPSRREIGLPSEWDNLRDGEHASLIHLACELAEATYHASLAAARPQTEAHVEALGEVYKRRTQAADRYQEARDAVEAGR